MKILLLLLFAIFLPFEDKITVWMNFGYGFNFTTIFLILLIIACVFGRKRPFVQSPLNMPVFLFMFIMFLHLWVGAIRLGYSPLGPELNAYKRFATTFILFFIAMNSVDTKKQMWALLSTMLLVMGFIAILTIQEHIQISQAHFSDEMRFHLVGMQTNDLGAFFAQYLPVAVSFTFIDKVSIRRGIYFGVFILAFFGLMYTYSRGAYLSVIVAMVIIMMAGKKKLFWKVLALSFAGLFIILVLGKADIVPSSVKERFTSITKEGDRDKSIRHRKDIWDETKRLIYKSPFVGYGYEASRYVSQRDTHNMYLDVALEGGIPAFLIFIWMLYRMFKVSLAVFKSANDPFYTALSLGVLGTLAAVCTGNLFGVRLGFFSSNGYFAILIGMVARINYENHKVRESEKNLKKKNKNGKKQLFV